VSDLSYHGRIRAIAVGEGDRVRTRAEDLVYYAEDNKSYLHCFKRMAGYGHSHKNNHLVAAELIASRLCHELCWTSEASQGGRNGR